MKKEIKSEMEQLEEIFHTGYASLQCAYCQQKITPVRVTKKYCSSTCRAKACLDRKRKPGLFFRFFNHLWNFIQKFNGK